MVPSEMEDGRCLLDVIGDANLLNEFLDAEGGEAGTVSRAQALAAAAQAQAEAQEQASHPMSTDAFTFQSHSLPPAATAASSLQAPAAGGATFLAPQSQPSPASQQMVSQMAMVHQQHLQQHQSSESVHYIPSQTVHHQPPAVPSNQRNGSPLVSVNPNVMVNQISTSQLQYLPGRSASPATGQQYVTVSAGSPLVSRTITPSQSPVPIQANNGSPMLTHTMVPNQASVNAVKVSRSVTPSQQSLSRPVSVSPASSMNTFQLPSSMHPPVQVANAMQMQGMIQTSPASATQQAQFTTNSAGQQFIQQKTLVQSQQQQHPSLVQAQAQVLQSQPTQSMLQIPNQNLLQAIQQNPGLLQNVNFTTQAVGTSQTGKPNSAVNVYSTVQAPVQNPVGLQGTIIQTAQGKSILIPNQQLSGQPITVTGLQNLQNLQPIAVRPTVNMNQQTNAPRVTTLHTGQGTVANTVGQPQISVLNINPQGQQIVIQRTQGPGQPQNIILRTIPSISSNFIQLQTGVQSSQIPTSQTTQISQSGTPISNPHTQTTTIPIQPLLNSSQGHQINMLNQPGQFQLGTTPGTVTLNIGNQNVNLKQLPSGNFQPAPLRANPHHPLQPSQPGQHQPIQLQLAQSQPAQSGTNILKSLQPPHAATASLPVISTQYSVKSSSAVPQTAASVIATPTSKSKKNKKAQAAANKVQPASVTANAAAASSNQNIQLIQQASQGVIVQNQHSVTGMLQQQQSHTHQMLNHNLNKDGRFSGTPQQLVNVVQNLQLPLSHIQTSIASSASSVNYSTANSTPVTTTVSHSIGRTISHVSVASSNRSAPVTSAAIHIAPQMHIGSTGVAQQRTLPTQVPVVSQSPAGNLSDPIAQVQVHAVGSSQPQVQVQAIQLTLQDQQTLQQVQHELKPLLALKQVTPEQNLTAQKLLLLQRKIVAKGRQQHLLFGGQQQLVRAANPQTGLTVPQQNTLSAQSQISGNGIHQISPAGMATVNQQTVVVHQQQQNMGVAQVTSTTPVAQPAGQATIKANQHIITMSNHLAQVIAAPKNAAVLTVENSASKENIVTGHNGTLQATPSGCVVTKQLLVPAIPANVPPGKLPISATPAVPTQLKIGDHLVTLSLTQAQKEKLQAQLAKMTPEQQQQFYRHQYTIIQRLQQQHQIQQQLKAAQIRNLQNQPKTGPDGKILIPIQQPDKSSKTSDMHHSPGRANKRTVITTEIPKSSMLHQQLSQDQEKGTNPDMKSCFKSTKDAVQRLLRYHVFQSPGPSLQQFNKIDRLFDQVSEDLLRKRDQMFAKYKLLLLDESMREKSTAEMVMIERILNQDLTDIIDEEKKIVNEDPESFEPMPSKYLKRSLVETKGESEESSGGNGEGPEAGVKMETEESGGEAVDVEHGSSPEKDPDHPPRLLDHSKSPVRSVMSSSGGFKLVIRKNHALNFTSPRADEAVEGKILDPGIVVKSESVETEPSYPKLDKSVLVSDIVKTSLESSIVPRVKSELQFTEMEGVDKVPNTPFKAFSSENHHTDMDFFFSDAGEGLSHMDGSRFSVQRNDLFPKTELSMAEEKKESTLGNNSGFEDISGDNDTLPDLEGTDDHVSLKREPSSEADGPRSQSETDTALQGLLNYSAMDTIDHGIHGYQFDPDDFQPMDIQTGGTDDHFDISDPFEENGDFFGYGGQYSEASGGPHHHGLVNDSHAATTASSENLLQSKVNGDSAAPEKVHAAESGDAQSTFGLMGQYEAISPVSDRSSGFNDDLIMQGAHATMMDGSGHQSLTSYYGGTVHAKSTTNHNQSHSFFRSGSENGPTSEVESAVDSIMDFGGSGDRSFSPLVMDDRGSRTGHSSGSGHFSASEALEQGDIRSHGGKASHYMNHVPQLVDFELNGTRDGGMSPGTNLPYLKSNMECDRDLGEENTNPIFKEQMESAINSILSPASSSDGQRDSSFSMESYPYTGQYDSYSNGQTAELRDHTATEDSAEESQDQSGIEDDLETAVNSILM